MRNFIKRVLIVLLLSLLFIHLQASDNNLSMDPYWAKLLHYSDGKSTINNESFFLSKGGKTNLEDELKETLISFKNAPEMICKYPARYKWLNKKLNLNIKHKSCNKLNEFLKPDFYKISMAFTSERYNSPASVFGHTFIKLESNEIPYVIDYTAEVGSKATSLTYAYRGIFGKYKSKYNIFPFFSKEYEYRDEEFRDLITFELDFTKDEIQNILLHLYEILQTNQDYYFLSRNCSSELIKLIDFANDETDLSSDLSFVTVPIDIVYILNKKNHIKNIGITISKLKLFNKTIGSLGDNELDMLNMIIGRKISVYKFDEDSSIPDDAKSRIILSAISYIEIKSLRDDFDTRLMYPLMKLIEIRDRYKSDVSFDKIYYIDSIPISDKFHRLTLGANYTQDKNSSVNIGYRYLYRNRFDLLDDVEKHGSVELFDLSLRTTNNELELNYLTLLNLEAMPISSGYFKEATHKIKLGISREFYSDLLYGYVNYGFGYRYRINKNLTYNIYAKAGVYYNDDDIYLGSGEFSLEYNVLSRFICELKFESSYFTDFSKNKTQINANNVYLNNYIKLSKNGTMNLALSYKDDIERYYNVNFSYNIHF